VLAYGGWQRRTIVTSDICPRGIVVAVVLIAGVGASDWSSSLVRVAGGAGNGRCPASAITPNLAKEGTGEPGGTRPSGDSSPGTAALNDGVVWSSGETAATSNLAYG